MIQSNDLHIVKLFFFSLLLLFIIVTGIQEQEEEFEVKLQRTVERERTAAAKLMRGSISSSSTAFAQQNTDIASVQRIKELHRVIAEHERTIRELKTQADDNIDRINVISFCSIALWENLFIYLFLYCSSHLLFIYISQSPNVYQCQWHLYIFSHFSSRAFSRVQPFNIFINFSNQKQKNSFLFFIFYYNLRNLKKKTVPKVTSCLNHNRYITKSYVDFLI